MRALRAVVPDGLGVGDADGEDGGEGAGGGHEAGEEAAGGGGDGGEGDAGGGEGGLDDGVVLGVLARLSAGAREAGRTKGRRGGVRRFLTIGKNWNCTRLPGAATSEFGTKERVLFMVETLMTCMTTLPVAIAAGTVVLEPSVIMSAVDVALEVTPVAIIIALGLLVVMLVGRMTFVVTLVPIMTEDLLATLVPRIIVGLLMVGVIREVVDFDVVGMSIIMEVDVLFDVVGTAIAVVVVAFEVVPAITIADVVFAIGSRSVDAFGSISADAIGSICAQTLTPSTARAVRDIGKCIAAR